MTTLLAINRTFVVNKTLLYLLSALLIAVATLPGISRAAPDGNDYVAVQAPDMAEAVAFFRDVMNCSMINDGDHASFAQEALLACGRETTVEITQAVPGQNRQGSDARDKVVTLNTDDATGVAAWLRSNRIRLIGSPTRLTTGLDAGKLAVSFLTPWGQPLQLVSRMKADDLLQTSTPAARIAEQ